MLLVLGDCRVMNIKAGNTHNSNCYVVKNALLHGPACLRIVVLRRRDNAEMRLYARLFYACT
jgi:hypothetical protein